MFPDVRKLGTQPTNARISSQCLTIIEEIGRRGWGGGELEAGAVLKQQRIFL